MLMKEMNREEVLVHRLRMAEFSLRRAHGGHVKLWAVIIILAFVAFGGYGCATKPPLTEAQQYERENKEVLRLEQWERDKLSCAASNGIIRVTRRGTYSRVCARGECPPSRWDHVECVHRG